jgi:hypothetical protein
MSMCPMCLAGLPSSCLTGSCVPTEIQDQAVLLSPTLPLIGTTDDNSMDEEQSYDKRSRQSRSRTKSRRGLSDSQSSGRKEAAKKYPLEATKPCEWQGLANCGGGDYPILGCVEGGFQQARHHGPDKNVSSNFEGNVHRICHYCHYRWHAKNDKTYDWNAGSWPLHNPRPLTPAEQSHQAVDYMRYLVKGKRKKLVIEE